ncbi:AAA-like domain-containing protein [Calothrix sp. PCC 7507]|uniref:AAA-like domain-containing protein n=1 Tax=Calothrix sp. PCC 7507 TaxID=99598 RepID=UPI0002DC31E7|nr:AAA-like domain-containing protein [Calothrix sp. PCC 7507]
MKYQVGGSLRSDDPTYIIRQADEQLYESLKAGDFCYVLNCRQMGKSSLLQRTSHRLKQAGYVCLYLDVTQLGSEQITSVQWYKGIIISLFYKLDLAQQVNIQEWWQQDAELSPIQRLHQFVEEILLSRVKTERIFIFIDEIDSLLSLNFPVNDFFAWIRHCYNLRTQNPDFERLGFALFGVASPSDLIADKRRTPFNIGKAIELYGFQAQEATPLLVGLKEAISQPEAVLLHIINWTGGQPFLTQKLCQLVVQIAKSRATGIINLTPGTEATWVEQLVRSHIIQNWQSQDEPEHLRTIYDRLLFNPQRSGRLLGLYQKILIGDREQGTEYSNLLVSTDDSREQTELLLSGLVEKRNGYLKIKNPIYRHVFDAEWVVRQLDNLRPYSQSFNAWVASNYQDKSRLLRGQALKDAQKWAQNKSISDLDYQFLAASQECEQQEVQTALEAARTKEVEARLAQERKTAKLQRCLLASVSIAAIVSTILSIGIFTLYRQALTSEHQARISEIHALISSSEGLLASNRRLDALIEAIKAQHRLQKLGQAKADIEPQVENVLQQAVYAADEYNRFSGHTSAVLAVDVSPDSSLIASASMDKTIKLWWRDGTQAATLQGHHAAVRAVDFSSDGQTLVSGGDDGTVKLWKRDGTLLKTLKGHTSGVWSVAMSPDDRFIASVSFDKTVRIWQREGTLVKTFQGYRVGFWGVAFSPDGQTLAAASFDGTIKLWQRGSTSWQNAKPLQILQGHKGWVTGITFSPDGQTIASGSEDKTVKIWQRDGNGSYRLDKTLKGNSAGVWGVAFSPDGQTVAAASLDKTIKLWNIDGTELRTLRGHSASVVGVSFSPDGSFIASWGGDNIVRLWQTQNHFQTSVIAHSSGIWSVTITADSSAIATAGHENTAKLWSRQGKLLKTVTEDDSLIFKVSFSDDGNLMAIAADNDTVKLRQRDGSLVATYKDPIGKLTSAMLSPDGQTIAMSNIEKAVQIWRRDRPPPQILRGHQAEVWQVVFSPDSRLIASASTDSTAKVWTLNGKLLSTLNGHLAAVWKVAFSHDSKIVASGSAD